NPPLKESPPVALFKKATKNLGYHPYQVASCNVSESYENPDGETLNQCQFCAFCTQYGCDFGAKSDPIVTVLPTARKNGNVEFRYESYTRRILHKEGKATVVMYIDRRTGEEHGQPADVVAVRGYTLTNN